MRSNSPATTGRATTTLLEIRGFSYPGTAGPVDAYLNGKQVLTQAKSGAQGYDGLDGGAIANVKDVLRFDRPNLLVFVTGENGFNGEVVLRRKPQPAEVLEVKGPLAGAGRPGQRPLAGGAAGDR